jgi:hypothetical protein
MSYLYSKLPETGVPHRIGTGGSEDDLSPAALCPASGCHSTERRAPIKPPSDAPPLKESDVRSGRRFGARESPQWVRLGSRLTQSRLPLFPQQQTFLSPAVTSEKC